MDITELIDAAARAAVEGGSSPPSWQAHASSIVMDEATTEPWRPRGDTPRGLIAAVELARKELRGAVNAKQIRLREQVRNCKLRIDTENEINGTSLAYPAWVQNYLERNSID
jgi:hypothetical protein